MSAPSVRERVRYAFDAIMARGTWALIAWHLIVAFAAVLLVSILVVVLGLTPVDAQGQPLGFGALVWETLMHAIAPSTITNSEGSEGWRALMMAATVFGILLVGSLVGVLVSNVTQRFEQLRQGRSRVLEHDHTLIVGWSRQVFTIVTELARANANRERSCVVVYTARDKIWVEDELRTKLRDTGRTRVVVRSGDPTDPETLEVVAPEHARAIIVLAPEDARDDTEVLRELLAVGRTEVAEGRAQHLVTEIRDPRNVAVAHLAGQRRTEVLQIGDLIAKIAVQTCLQVGLSAVYEELLSFTGSEIYFVDATPLIGRSFGEALQDLEDAMLLGLRTGAGEVSLAPAMDRAIAAGEQLIVLALDDDRVSIRRSSGVDGLELDASVESPAPASKPVRTLILGWSDRVPSIVTGLDAYVAPGSEITVVDRDDAADAALSELEPRLRATSLWFRCADIGDRRVLEELDPHAWDHVLVLPDPTLDDPAEADAQVLVALLHLRDLEDPARPPFSLVSEMRDLRSRDLAEVARADDFIISDRIIGRLLAQIAEHADLGAVFVELFDPEGAEIYLRPASAYLDIAAGDTREVEVRVLIEAGRRRGEVVFGVHRARDARRAEAGLGVVLNPAKHERLRLGAEDRIIVLAAS